MSKRFNSEVYLDELKFANGITIEHNTLGSGNLAHILRNRTVVASTSVATDKWFHYDQVGSVMAESDSAGASAQLHYQDAFGNSQSGWSAGLPGGVPNGWHHNTKAFSSTLGFSQMGKRAYMPELGLFMSSAPYPPMMEHRFGFAYQSPARGVDPSGEIPWPLVTTGLGPHPNRDGDEGNICGKIWGAPNTIIGALYGGFGSLLGLGGSMFGWTDSPAISFGNNALQFENNPLTLPGTAITIGNTTSYGSGAAPSSLSNTAFYSSTTYPGGGIWMGDHEEGHTYQSETLGIFMGPTYVIGIAIGGISPLDHQADNFAGGTDDEYEIHLFD